MQAKELKYCLAIWQFKPCNTPPVTIHYNKAINAFALSIDDYITGGQIVLKTQRHEVREFRTLDAAFNCVRSVFDWQGDILIQDYAD